MQPSKHSNFRKINHINIKRLKYRYVPMQQKFNYFFKQNIITYVCSKYALKSKAAFQKVVEPLRTVNP